MTHVRKRACFHTASHKARNGFIAVCEQTLHLIREIFFMFYSATVLYSYLSNQAVIEAGKIFVFVFERLYRTRLTGLSEVLTD